MPRFFVAGSNLAGGVALIAGADAEHIKVLRMKIGEKLVVCDGAGKEYDCRLTRLGDGTAEAEILSERSSPAEPIVQKSTECGAAEIVFFPAYRCVARPEGKSLERKLDRWQRIAEEAAKQSGRAIVPEVRAVEDYGQMLELGIKQSLKLFLYEAGERTPILDAVAGDPKAASCAVVTGPEGGFENHEVELARRVGFTICSMGPRILRCETAPVVALTAVLCGTGNL